MTGRDMRPGRDGAAGSPDPGAVHDRGRPVLDVTGLRVAFPGTGAGRAARAGREVLRGIDLQVAAGECVAVVGGSGAGKSVLARALVGLAGEAGPARVRADRHDLLGRDLRGLTERGWRAVRGRDVGLVLQDALQSLDPLRTVGAEVGEALAVRRPGSAPLPRTERHARVLAALTDAGLPDPEVRARQRSGELSGGMRQRALIAAALVGRPPLLVADEPTTALDATVAARVLDLLAGLRDRGTALVLITHDLAAVARVADRVLVIDDGTVVEQGPTAQVLHDPAHAVTRALVDAARLADGPGPVPPPGEPVLVGRGLRRAFPLPAGAGSGSGSGAGTGSGTDAGQVVAVDDVDVVVRAGEAVGIVGESGSGKTTLSRLLLAADRPDAGQVTLDGGPWSDLPERARRPLRPAVRFVPQDPLGSFDPRATVRDLLRQALRTAGRGAGAREVAGAGGAVRHGADRGRESAVGPGAGLDERREDAGAREGRGPDGAPEAGAGMPQVRAATPEDLLALVHLPPEVLDRRPRTLSGGQRQRVAIARALAGRPRVLVLDEPVSALDVQVQAAVLDLLVELRRTRGLTLVLVSHDLGVIRRVCDTVLVMSAGRVVERGPVAEVFAAPAHPVTRDLLAARALDPA
jgi:peptide/nickel transport system ATP-binding protein